MNLYQTLDVGKNVSQEEITAAYRRLVKKYHPDRNPGDDEAAARFKEVQEAYDILSDEAKRQYYNDTGEIPRPTEGPDEIDSIPMTSISGAGLFRHNYQHVPSLTSCFSN